MWKRWSISERLQRACCCVLDVSAAIVFVCIGTTAAVVLWSVFIDPLQSTLSTCDYFIIFSFVFIAALWCMWGTRLWRWLRCELLVVVAAWLFVIAYEARTPPENGSFAEIEADFNARCPVGTLRSDVVRWFAEREGRVSDQTIADESRHNVDGFLPNGTLLTKAYVYIECEFDASDKLRRVFIRRQIDGL